MSDKTLSSAADCVACQRRRQRRVDGQTYYECRREPVDGLRPLLPKTDQGEGGLHLVDVALEGRAGEGAGRIALGRRGRIRNSSGFVLTRSIARALVSQPSRLEVSPEHRHKAQTGSLLFDKIQDDSFGGQLVVSSKRERIGPARTVGFAQFVSPIYLDMAIVSKASAEGGRDGLVALEPAEAVGWREAGHFDQDVVDVCRAPPRLEDGGQGQGRVEAIDVPVKGARAARDDGSYLRGRLLAAVAEHGLAILALLEEVWQLVVAVSFPAHIVSRCKGRAVVVTYLTALVAMTSS